MPTLPENIKAYAFFFNSRTSRPPTSTDSTTQMMHSHSM